MAAAGEEIGGNIEEMKSIEESKINGGNMASAKNVAAKEKCGISVKIVWWRGESVAASSRRRSGVMRFSSSWRQRNGEHRQRRRRRRGGGIK